MGVMMKVDVSTEDEAEITLLIKNHFEGMRWTRDIRPDWGRFSSDFLPGASLFPAARPVQIRTVKAFIERMNDTETNHDISAYLLVKNEGKWLIAAHAWDKATAERTVPDYLR
jgi:hypothetical protein